jgi:hypothetical protein
MPDYELWIVEGNRTLPSVHARDENHAVSLYGEQLGLGLEIEGDQGVQGPYGMLRETRERNAHWAKQARIPVWKRNSDAMAAREPAPRLSAL